MKTFTFSRFCKMRIVILFTSLCPFLVSNAAASPTTFSYQGRILSSTNGSPGFTMASFSFSVMVDKAGGKNPNCTIFREQKDLVPLSADGLFDVAIGEGTANFPNSSAKVYDYMNNSGTVSCAEGGTFLLSASDRRFLDVQFNPNGTSGWNHITPASEIRAVPYATNAISAEKLGGLVATDYVRKTDLTGCTTGQFVTYNGSAFGCDTPAGGGSSFDASYSIKGLVQFLTNAATSGIVVTNGVAHVNTGTGANQIVKLDGTGKLPAVDGSALTGIVASSATTAATATNFSGSLSGDVSGTQGATSVDKIKGAAVDTTGISTGKILKYDGSKWTMADDATGGSPTDSSYSAKGVVQFDTSAAVSGITIAAGVAKVNAGTGANQIVQLDSASKLPAIDGSALTNIVASSISGILDIAKGGTGQTTKTAAFDALSPLATKGSILTHDGTNNVTLPVGSTNGYVLMVDSAQSTGIKWAAPTATDLTTITGTGIVQRTGAGTYTVLGTTAPMNVTGSNIGLAYGTGLTTSSGSLVVDTGTTTGKIVAMDTANRLPAVDGSQLTNIVASSFSGTLPIANGGTGATTLTGAGILLNGGNSFGAAASVGTNDAYDFKIETGGSDRITVASGGNVGIGTSSTINDKLEVNGSIRGKSYDNGTTTTIDWSRGNTQSVTSNCGSQMTFSNMRDGGVYTLAVTASTTFSGSCTFAQTSPDTLSGTAGSGAFYFLPANATASGANAVYSFMRIGTKVYVNWSSGYAN
ncbi:hypothetical protein B9G69_000445 [Bdellovibrio sp. SKB1291214]|uniref:hypothetical protein n=1 Tax=Bdellovibrio sp. SKB1291214 TaxID=1732569 RepID=UPI000B51B647|nr:hypothetical protein [Bdellovibrio sp. SKB1291214]UYL09043.1 hypothetical protein B9G69_000445 [Bdellovibrio sp. SKB1291214]